MERNTKRRLGWLVAANLLASGCAFSIDASLIKESRDADMESAKQDASEPLDSDVEMPEQDASQTADAGTDGDLSVWDAGGPPDACTGADCPAPCSEDADCGADEYCSIERAGCAPRCDDERGCVGPRVNVSSLLGEGQNVYFSTLSTGTDRLGNPRPDAAIWRWNLRDEPVMIAGGLSSAELLFVADDYIYYFYYHGSYPSVDRVRLVPGSTPEIVDTDARRAWKTERFVYWTAYKASSVELWRRARSGSSAPERVAEAMHEGWVAGNDEIVYCIERRELHNIYDEFAYHLVAEQLANLPQRRDVFQIGSDIAGAYRRISLSGSVLYFATRSSFVERVDLEAPAGRSTVSPYSSRNVRFAERDGWLYWAVNEFSDGEANEPTVIGRTRGDQLFEPEVLLECSNCELEFALAEEQLVYVRTAEGRLFSFSLPALPCSSMAPCPEGQSCGPAMQCE